MIKVVLLCSLISMVLSAPQSQEPVAILSQNSVVNADGSYQFSYESADGTKVQQSGQEKALQGDADGSGQSISGSFTFVGQDGQQYTVNYVADENGFVPQADHLPQAPPIPEAIARSLEYNQAHPEEEQGN
ncbi:endocuticle structural glycoprotein SgAbd-3-like [Periplaneta americana]|uniref:endocuticle structural glycoprotein SgAbd-3-like n=1 Tax=Periplaneta americana TaxID=6978 RepID=UPI0037E72273